MQKISIASISDENMRPVISSGVGIADRGAVAVNAVSFSMWRHKDVREPNGGSPTQPVADSPTLSEFIAIIYARVERMICR
jgi:hypothetical protein